MVLKSTTVEVLNLNKVKIVAIGNEGSESTIIFKLSEWVQLSLAKIPKPEGRMDCIIQISLAHGLFDSLQYNEEALAMLAYEKLYRIFKKANSK